MLTSLSNLRRLQLSLKFRWQRDTGWGWLQPLHLTSIHLSGNSSSHDNQGVLGIHANSHRVSTIVYGADTGCATLHRLGAPDIQVRGTQPYDNAEGGEHLVSS